MTPTSPRFLAVALVFAAMPTALHAQFGGGPPVPTTGWAPASIGVRGGYDNSLEGWMVGGFLAVPVLPRGSIELMPSADITFLPGFKEYQGSLDLVYLTAGRRGGVYAGAGVGVRNSVFGPDPDAERRSVLTFDIVTGLRLGSGSRIRPLVEIRWILQDEYGRDPRHVELGVGFSLW